MVPVSAPLLWIVFDNSLDADTCPAFIGAAGQWIASPARA
jgi:hypothetical protein